MTSRFLSETSERVAPETVYVWICQSCGAWTSNSYFDFNENSAWRPRCKSKDGCPKPELVPFVYRLKGPA